MAYIVCGYPMKQSRPAQHGVTEAMHEFDHMLEM